jgi:hypothetical protein
MSVRKAGEFVGEEGRGKNEEKEFLFISLKTSFFFSRFNDCCMLQAGQFAHHTLLQFCTIFRNLHPLMFAKS